MNFNRLLFRKILLIPTFIMPLTYIIAIICFFLNVEISESYFFKNFGLTVVKITLVLIPIYIFWIIKSHFLTTKDKIKWIFFTIALNMFAMPAYYIYESKNWKESDRLKIENDRVQLAKNYLKSSHIYYDNFNDEQLSAIYQYSQLTKYKILRRVLATIILFFSLYFSFIFFPQNVKKIFSDDIPSTIIVDKKNNKNIVDKPDKKFIDTYIENIFMYGAQAGLCFSMGIFLFINISGIGISYKYDKIINTLIKSKS